MKKSSKLLILEDNKVLIRYFEDNHSGKIKYDLPGGKVEDGETVEEAAVREGIEELGLKVLDPVLVYEEELPEIGLKGYFFKVTKCDDGYDMAPEKDVTIGKLIWMDIDEAKEKLTFDICKRALGKVI